MAESPTRRHDPNPLQSRLSGLLKVPVSLTVTDNSRSMISVKHKNHGYFIRIHHMFLQARDSTVYVLAQYILRGTAPLRKQLAAFIRRNEHRIKEPARPRRPRTPRIRNQGRVFNLLDAYRRINESYFRGEVDCPITWGNRRRTPGKRTIRLGSYSARSGIIRINPVLDDDSVPAYVLEEVIYHEMLHHVLGPRRRDGRTLYHHEDFRNMEEAFAQRESARQWIRRNLPRLLGQGAQQ